MAFPIGFWNYPSVDALTLRDVDLWADCGMTLTMSPTYEDNPEHKRLLRLTLERCAERGVRLILRDARTLWQGAAEDPEAYRARFRAALGDFGAHPATCGFFVGDEPAGEKQFADCVTALRIQREEAPDKVGFLNFNPYWPGMERTHLQGKAFDVWAKEFIAESRCQMISYDCYTQLNPGEDGIERYFLNLRMFSEAARAANVPLWTTLLSCGHFRYRVPTQDDLRWQINTAVACGCRGLMWFLFYDPDYRNYRGAPVDVYGETTPTYDALKYEQRLFHDHYGDLLTRLHWQKAYHIEKAYGGWRPFVAGEDALILNASSDWHVPGLLAFFTDEAGRRYVALVNNSLFKSDLFRLTLAPGARVINVRKNGADEQDMALSHHDAFYAGGEGWIQAGVWLAPGQLELFRLEARDERS